MACLFIPIAGQDVVIAPAGVGLEGDAGTVGFGHIAAVNQRCEIGFIAIAVEVLANAAA